MTQNHQVNGLNAGSDDPRTTSNGLVVVTEETPCVTLTNSLGWSRHESTALLVQVPQHTDHVSVYESAIYAASGTNGDSFPPRDEQQRASIRCELRLSHRKDAVSPLSGSTNSVSHSPPTQLRHHGNLHGHRMSVSDGSMLLFQPTADNFLNTRSRGINDMMATTGGTFEAIVQVPLMPLETKRLCFDFKSQEGVSSLMKHRSNSSTSGHGTETPALHLRPHCRCQPAQVSAVSIDDVKEAGGHFTMSARTIDGERSKTPHFFSVALGTMLCPNCVRVTTHDEDNKQERVLLFSLREYLVADMETYNSGAYLFRSFLLTFVMLWISMGIGYGASFGVVTAGRVLWFLASCTWSIIFRQQQVNNNGKEKHEESQSVTGTAASSHSHGLPLLSPLLTGLLTGGVFFASAHLFDRATTLASIATEEPSPFFIAVGVALGLVGSAQRKFWQTLLSTFLLLVVFGLLLLFGLSFHSRPVPFGKGFGDNSTVLIEEGFLSSQMTFQLSTTTAMQLVLVKEGDLSGTIFARLSGRAPTFSQYTLRMYFGSWLDQFLAFPVLDDLVVRAPASFKYSRLLNGNMQPLRGFFSFIYNHQTTVIPAQPTGIVPMHGGVEVGFHRNPGVDDERGLKEPLVDGSFVTQTYAFPQPPMRAPDDASMTSWEAAGSLFKDYFCDYLPWRVAIETARPSMGARVSLSGIMDATAPTIVTQQRHEAIVHLTPPTVSHPYRFARAEDLNSTRGRVSPPSAISPLPLSVHILSMQLVQNGVAGVLSQPPCLRLQFGSLVSSLTTTGSSASATASSDRFNVFSWVSMLSPMVTSVKEVDFLGRHTSEGACDHLGAASTPAPICTILACFSTP